MLSTRQHRLNSASSSQTSLSSRHSTSRTSTSSTTSQGRPRPLERQNTPDQQHLTPEEAEERKYARKQLEKKRAALEEAVERRVTEKIYDRIFRHRSTQDEAADQKLRSKTAALAVVGIGLTDLGIDLGQGKDAEKMSEKEKEVRRWLEGARRELREMNEEKSPLGKLMRLKAAHKCIVETLSHFHPSSSADEIMPMLIYTLITSPVEDIDVISNLHYIQRFRSEMKIDGEAAYCLTNLEAAITFLETVDLSSLRAEEAQSGPAKTPSSRPTTPTIDSSTPTSASITSFPAVTLATPQQGISAPVLSPALIIPPTDATPVDSSPTRGLRPGPTNRRFSELSSTVTASKDAVLSTADQGLKTIGSSLGQSYDFLIGKLKERQESLHDVLVPKTLDDARKLVDGPDEDDGSSSKASSMHTLSSERTNTDKLVSMISGRPPQPQPQPRDRSVDSALSAAGSLAGSRKATAFLGADINNSKSRERPSASPLSAVPNVATEKVGQAVEGIRALSSSFNPMTKFAQMRAGFGRSAAAPAEDLATKDGAVEEDAPVINLAEAFPDLAVSLATKEAKEEKKEEPQKEVKKIAPPIQRFMDVRSPGDLKLSEVVELLRDYRRLAKALKDMGAV